MAETQPQVFLALMGLDSGTASTNRGGSPLPAGGGGVRKPVNAGMDGEPKNYAYYKDLRKKLGVRYYEPHIQQQLIKDRKALGEEFYDKQS
jgi:hypothetical protein